MALTRMRPKIAELREALVGRFDEHHAAAGSHAPRSHRRADASSRPASTTRSNRLMVPFAEAATRLLSIPGIGKRVAEIIVAEIGVDMSRFATAAHLASWAGLCPGHHESAGKRRSGKARKGDAALRTALCEAAWSAGHCKDGYLPAQYPAVPAPVREEEREQGDLRRRPHVDRHRLARPPRRLRLRRSRRRLLRAPQRRRRPPALPRPRTRKARPHRHPPTSSLNTPHRHVGLRPTWGSAPDPTRPHNSITQGSFVSGVMPRLARCTRRDENEGVPPVVARNLNGAPNPSVRLARGRTRHP